MLSMLLEEHKEVQRLRRQMDEITGQLPAGEERMLLDEETEGEPAEDVHGFDRLSHRGGPAAELVEADRTDHAPEVIDADPS
jgi:hypothetical protein